MKQVALDAALPVGKKESILQSEKEILRFFVGQGWIDAKAGMRRTLPGRLTQFGESLVQPSLQFAHPIPLGHAVQFPNISRRQKLPRNLMRSGDYPCRMIRRSGNSGPLRNQNKNLPPPP